MSNSKTYKVSMYVYVKIAIPGNSINSQPDKIQLLDDDGRFLIPKFTSLYVRDPAAILNFFKTLFQFNSKL